MPALNLQLNKWPINPNLHPGFRRHKGLAPWCLINISKWEWIKINEWLGIHGYCGRISKYQLIEDAGLLLGEVFVTESVLWIDPNWQAACLQFIDSLPKRIYTVQLNTRPTRKQANKLFTDNYEVFSGYNYHFGTFSSEQDAFMATMGWQS